MMGGRTLVFDKRELAAPPDLYYYTDGTVLKNKLWGGHLWNPSYFVATVSENTEEQVKKYIENQNVKTKSV
jgi:REP element-mobilizing transposase RayT